MFLLAQEKSDTIESLNLEITTMLRKQLIVLPPEARKIWDQIKYLDDKYCHLRS